MKSVFLYQDKPHSVHRKFAHSVTSSFESCRQFDGLVPGPIDVFLKSFSLSKSNFYLGDAGAYFPAALRKKVLPNQKYIVILLNVGAFYDTQIEHIPTHLRFFRFIHCAVLDEIDGVISVSKFSEENFNRFGPDVPKKIVHPFIEKKKYKRLGEVNPNFDNKNIVTISRNAPKKGLDILIKAFNEVQNDFPEAELYIIGEDTEKLDGGSVHGEGWVEDFVPYLEKASLYVQASRHDPFPVSTLEAMRAGLPTIVTDMVGTKEVVEKVNREFVLEVDYKSLATGIKKWLQLKKGQKLNLSKKFRKAAEAFKEEKKVDEFRKKFNELKDEITVSGR